MFFRYERKLNMIGVIVVLLGVLLTGSPTQARETLFGCEGETLHLRYDINIIIIISLIFNLISF